MFVRALNLKYNLLIIMAVRLSLFTNLTCPLCSRFMKKAQKSTVQFHLRHKVKLHIRTFVRSI